jgi:FkbM family methyltransferase
MKFKKLRKIYRILFPLHLTEAQIFKNKLLSNSLISNIEDDNDSYIITFSKNHKVVVRNQNHSDYDVFKQIFNFEEYKIILSLLSNNPPFLNGEKVLIDAGANVGYSTVYFLNYNIFSKVFCIEPSSSNVEVLRKNINLLDISNNIFIYENGLCGRENVRFELGNSFRDGRDWSNTTNENYNGTISGITINQIVRYNNLKEITFLKVDIEGAERFIFNNESDISFLNITKIIAIEIHDEFLIRDVIYKILKEKGFLILESGELTIGIDKSIIR